MSTDYETKRRIGATLSKLTDLTQSGDLTWSDHSRTVGKALPVRHADFRARHGEDEFRLLAGSELAALAGGEGSDQKPILYVRQGGRGVEERFPPTEFGDTFDGHLRDLLRTVESRRAYRDALFDGLMDRILGD